MMQETPSASVADTETPRPACSASGPGTQHWRETTYDDSLLEFYRPCESPECFPAGLDSETISTVIRTSHSRVIHRPRAVALTDAETDTLLHAHGEAEVIEQFTDACSSAVPDGGSGFEESEPVPIDALTEFCSGDGVMWDGLGSPLVVCSVTTEPDCRLHLEGPSGGEYVLEARSGKRYIVYDGYGFVENLRRLPPASSLSASSASAE
jgi:hypothetical protein